MPPLPQVIYDASLQAMAWSDSERITWRSALPAGQYALQALPGGEVGERFLFLHAGYALSEIKGMRERYGLAG